MNDMTPSAQPLTTQQRKYLGSLLVRAHAHGVPYLPVEQLSRKQASGWIDYLQRVVGADPSGGDAKSSPAPTGGAA